MEMTYVSCSRAWLGFASGSASWGPCAGDLVCVPSVLPMWSSNNYDSTCLILQDGSEDWTGLPDELTTVPDSQWALALPPLTVKLNPRPLHLLPSLYRSHFMLLPLEFSVFYVLSVLWCVLFGFTIDFKNSKCDVIHTWLEDSDTQKKSLAILPK